MDPNNRQNIGLKHPHPRWPSQWPGQTKIWMCCQQAKREEWQWVWIDTCCIDQGNHAELSEAINTMFKYYEDAGVCYVYLEDVSSADCPTHMALKANFRRSRWFKRGWTLQELLAPRFIRFMDRNWNFIGTQDDWSEDIEQATGIKEEYLRDYKQCCVATKFSWASGRQTERIEDRSYSLLGLLGINMPLIYGEGMKAFERLQREVIRYSDDESIFAWEYNAVAAFGPAGMPLPTHVCWVFC